MNNLIVSFYVAYPYYFPHFLPISKVFEANGYQVLYILSDEQNSTNMKEIANDNNVNFIFGEENLNREDIGIVFFANNYDKVNDISAKTVFLDHGLGAKKCNYGLALIQFDIILVEGNHRLKNITNQYPEFKNKIHKVGFSKYDSIVNLDINVKDVLYKKYNMDKIKKTILYAPTFFPSSIEKMEDTFPEEFKDCNIIVKPHYLTYERSKYKKQIQKLNNWAKYDNCFIMPLSEYNLVPFMAISDIMISDESSAMFEFAALNKPVISNRYFKLRWSYYLMPWKLKKRVDNTKDFYRTILDNANNYQETIQLTKEALINPTKLEKKRLKFSQDLCGEIDGKVSNRIFDILIKI